MRCSRERVQGRGGAWTERSDRGTRERSEGRRRPYGRPGASGVHRVSKVVWDVIIVLIIVSVGGFFASAEMALVSLREGQVRALAQRGKRGARAAKLAADPNRFLSAVQIGMTLATLMSGAFGADTLAGVLRSWFVQHGIAGDAATPLAFAIVTVCITFVSLVLGELAPKRFALQRAVPLSLLAAPLLDFIATLARPVVWLLSISVNLIVAM